MEHRKCPIYKRCKMYDRKNILCNKFGGIISSKKVCSFYKVEERRR